MTRESERVTPALSCQHKTPQKAFNSVILVFVPAFSFTLLLLLISLSRFRLSAIFVKTHWLCHWQRKGKLRDRKWPPFSVSLFCPIEANFTHHFKFIFKDTGWLFTLATQWSLSVRRSEITDKKNWGVAFTCSLERRTSIVNISVLKSQNITEERERERERARRKAPVWVQCDDVYTIQNW